MQSGLGDERCIKTPLEGETRFLRCVIERAYDEVFTVMSLRASRQFVVFIGKPLHDFLPWDVGAQRRSGRCCKNETPERKDQSPKTDSIGPPIRISMGSRFHSYS